MDEYTPPSVRCETAHTIAALAVTANDLPEGTAKRLVLDTMKLLVADLAPPPVVVQEGNVLTLKR